MTQWPDQIELELHSIAQGGAAVGRFEGRAVFAEGGLPGETVRVRLFDRQKTFARGRVIDVLRAAPERVPSFCPLEHACGAADWRAIDPLAQRRFKRQILADQLRHLGGLEVAVQPVGDDAPAPHGYRTTAELHVAGAAIGYFRPGTRRVADVPACCIHHPLINNALAALRLLLTPAVSLQTITLRCSPETGATLAVLDGRGPLRELAQRWRAGYDSLAGVVAGRGALLDGQNWIERRVGDLRLRISATSFFQINAFEVAPLVARVGQLLDLLPASRLLDLYCGVGLFGLSYAPRVAEVLGVEEWAGAVADARHNTTSNAITNARFEAGAAERIVASLRGYDRVVLDPPRRGCAPAVLDALATIQPERIVYVSCHPGTLARDCKRLAEAGYRIVSAEVIDMFPQTHHVESIVALSRA